MNRLYYEIINCIMKVKMKKLLISTSFFLCFSGLSQADLAKSIEKIISRSLQQKVTFSIHIIKADSGGTVYDYDAKKSLIPASNMKVITTAAALKYLGPDYEYVTKIGLLGDKLLIIGSGDPLLGDEKTNDMHAREQGWIFRDIADALNRRSITTIDDIIVDSSVFDNQRVHPGWPAKDLNKWYACEVSGLNYNDNCISLSTERIGARVAVSIEPQTGFVELINNVKPISSGSSAVGTYRNSQPNKLTVYGKCRKKVGPFEVAIERPAAFFGFLLAENLATAGIKVKGQFVEKAVGDRGDFQLLTECSTALTDCLARANKDSLGLVAEALFKTIAAANAPDGRNGSWDKGRELISEYLLRLGIDRDQFYIDDGSGLSRQNQLSAYAITTVLSDVYNRNYWPVYRDSLAVGGVDGTIDKYFKEKKYKGKILGKTGYIDGVKTFSGICSTAEGDFIFSILANNANGRTRIVLNKIAQAIIENAE
jgi:D-alanyl-D-alanine carboxypeptidase/D-alanyl-D-alanine-endopeptidase (penicillin-binding protein 4)